ncbi:FtsH protease activity modulator HflK [bacterium]|nr:FtsH protease activity modulator HflK [bacterium]
MDSNQNLSNPLVDLIVKNIRYVVIIVGVLIFFSSAFFKIEPEEVGVILRFGKFTKTVDPGLNFKIPFMETVYKVPVERQQKLEFGFRTQSANVRTQYAPRVTRDESLMLTGDLNLADVEWVVQYRINDPYQYLFKVRNPESTLRDIAESAMRQVVGDRTVNEVLTVGRAEISSKLEELMQEVCVEYSIGVKIEQVVLQDVNPPELVKAAFNAVNEAQQEKETLINQAKSEYNKVIPKAAGQAQETIQMAEGYATERVNNALGDVARFNELYKEYIKAPGVTKKRIYLETMEEIIPKLGQKIITDQDGGNVLPLLQMHLNQQNK